MVGKCRPFGCDSSPFPLGKSRVFIFTTMRRCSLKLERPSQDQQSTQSNTPTVWVTPGPAAAVLGCTAWPRETGLKIQLAAPFKGSAGNRWNQTVAGKRCVFERWPKLKATHSSLMSGQVRGTEREGAGFGFGGAEGRDVDGLWLVWECPFLKVTPAVYLFFLV